ncbi:MAG TPA: lytic murein transglycosylase [Acidimicrobiia bacterium]|nr:lytic murein transglycosylase [Acidimicrobiia bacterium]
MGTKKIVALLVTLTLAGACGGDDDGDQGDGTAAVETTTTTIAETTTTTAAPESSTTTTRAATTKTTAKPAAASPTTVSTGRSTGTVETRPYATVFVAAAPTEPAELDRLAGQLTADETALRNPATPAAEIPALARRQQAAYRALSARPAALPHVLARLPEALRPIAQANVDAGAELRAMTKPKSDLPPWKILPPPPAEELTGYYKEAEARFGVPWAYLASVHLVETRMGRIRGTSTAGAQGPMQFLPATWKAYGMGGDINNPRDAIFGAANYLKANGGAAGRMDNALFRYNNSNRYVRAVTLYAKQIEADPLAYRLYHQWQVYYITPRGDLWLEEGYGS